MYYRWYIDDILLVWTSTREELTKFQNHLNNVHPTIKFKFEVSDKKIQYLDLTIHKSDHNCYIFNLFKETNTFSYVLEDSYHPQSVFKGIYMGENTRILGNCTRKDYEDTIKFDP